MGREVVKFISTLVDGWEDKVILEADGMKRAVEQRIIDVLASNGLVHKGTFTQRQEVEMRVKLLGLQTNEFILSKFLYNTEIDVNPRLGQQAYINRCSVNISVVLPVGSDLSRVQGMLNEIEIGAYTCHLVSDFPGGVEGTAVTGAGTRVDLLIPVFKGSLGSRM